MTAKQKSDCRKIADMYGTACQEKQTISEISELLLVLTRRADQRKSGWKNSLCEEIADNLIMIYQICYLYGVDDKSISEVIDYKIERTLNKMKSGE